MTKTRVRLAFAVLTLSGLVTAFSLGAAPASAASTKTSIDFESNDPVEVGFNEDWFMSLHVEAHFGGEDHPLSAADGTVDVFVSGIAGIFAEDLPIQSGGAVFVSQSSTQPLLPAGSYPVTAVFNPAPGSGFASSQTPGSRVLTIQALDVMPNVTIAMDPAVSELPVISASLSGAYIDAIGGAPAGTWHFELSDSDGDVVFQQEAPQSDGATDPVRLEVAAELGSGQSYSLETTFTPVEEFAGGVTVATIPARELVMPGGGLFGAMGAAVAVPLWLAILLLVLVLGAAAGAIILGRKLSAVRSRGAAPASAGDTDAGQPATVEPAAADPIVVESESS